MPATLVDLDQRERAVSRTGAGDRSGPWPGCIPAPSPSTVYDPPRPIDVFDADGSVVQVSGRGVTSAAPASVVFSLGDESSGWRRSDQRSVRAWAGPWPVDQHWWEPGAHRRLARFQVVVADDDAGEEAHLIVAEHRRWFLLATYG